MNDLYKVLGVDKNASQEDIKSAYKEKAKDNHEDRGGDHEKMVEINMAYLVLRDPAKRNKYDRTGETSSESFDVKFRGYVQQIFMSIIDNHDVDYTDLIGEFRAYNSNVITDNLNSCKEAKKRLNKLNKVLKRLGDNSGVIGQVVLGNIDGLKMDIAMIEDNIKFLDDCAECLNSYHYSFDERPNDMMGGFVWVNINHKL